MPAQERLGLDEEATPTSPDNRRLSPVSRARSAGSSAGRTIWRRSTATSWRSMTISAAASSAFLRRRRSSERIRMKAM